MGNNRTSKKESEWNISIFVDRLMNHGWKLRGHSVSNCHLWTDGDTEELHLFAEKIGLKRKWFQISRSGIEHYDLTESRRKKAIEFGAIEI